MGYLKLIETRFFLKKVDEIRRSESMGCDFNRTKNTNRSRKITISRRSTVWCSQRFWSFLLILIQRKHNEVDWMVNNSWSCPDTHSYYPLIAL